VPHGPEAKVLAAHQVVARLKVADEALFVVSTLPCLPNPCNATTPRHSLTMSLFARVIAAEAAGPREALQTVVEKLPQSDVHHEIDP
jgi:hypothetical protein